MSALLGRFLGEIPPHPGGPHAKALTDLRVDSLAALQEAQDLRRQALRQLQGALNALDRAEKKDLDAVNAEVAVRALEADAEKATVE